MFLSASVKTAKPSESVEELLEVEYVLIPICLILCNLLLDWKNKLEDLVLFKSYVKINLLFKINNISRSLLCPFSKEV